MPQGLVTVMKPLEVFWVPAGNAGPSAFPWSLSSGMPPDPQVDLSRKLSDAAPKGQALETVQETSWGELTLPKTQTCFLPSVPQKCNFLKTPFYRRNRNI